MTDKVLPGQEDQPKETMCSSCGRFVGALTRCPYCGARVTKRLSVMAFRYAALLLATVGLGLLYLMARTQQIPLIRVADIKPTMNFAYVRIAGVVSGDARMFKEGGKIRSMRFMVDDGSGEISVTAYRTQAQALSDAGRLPRLGDKVEVAGSLSITADGDPVMRLQVAEQLVVNAAEMEVTALADIDEGMVGTSILVEGTIVNVAAPGPNSKAPWTVTIRDATGERQITFWKDIHEEIRDKLLLSNGTKIRARVSIKTYRDKVQLSLGRGADLEFPDARSASNLTAGPGAASGRGEEVAIADITPEMKGRAVRVKGRVSAINPPTLPKAPHEVILEDGGSTITVVYWDTVVKHLRENKPIVGAQMAIEGTVDVYKEKLQLKVNHSQQMQLLDAVPSRPEPSGNPIKVSAVTRAMLKQSVTLSGTLGEPKSIKSGIIFPLSDGSGEIQIVLWDRRVPGPDRNRLAAGAQVTVTGEVDEYKGTLQIVPPKPQSIVVVREAGK